MKRIIYKALLLPVVLNLFFQTFAQTTLWVSPNGSGTGFSEAAPGSLTGDALKNEIVTLRRSGEQNIQVLLKEGVYSLDVPVVVDSEMAGSPADTLAFIGIATDPGTNKGKAVISGGKQVTGWQDSGNGIYKALLPEGVNFRQLYVNGQPAIRARHPNRENETDYGPYWRIQTLTNNANDATIKINASEFKHWSNMQEVEIVLNQHWYQCRLKVNAVEEQGEQTIITGSLRTSDWGEKEVVYYWENSLDFLDAEREWYFDKQTRWLYYKPSSKEDLSRVEVIYPAMNRLFSIEGTATTPVYNVSVQNIEFAYSNWTAPGINGMVATQAVQPRYGVEVESMIQVSYADKVQLTDCNIFCVGGNGVTFAAEVNNSAVIACHFDRIAANPIVIDKNARDITEPSFSDNRLAHNLIENFGMNYTNGMGILASCVTRLIIEHNEIRYSRYGGLQVGNQYGEKVTALHDNRIRYNNVHHVMWLHDDSGGIYTLARQDGTRIYQNWVHDIVRGKWAGDYAVGAIYLDNNTSYITVENNVLLSPIPFSVVQVNNQINDGIAAHDNIIRNNDTQNPEIMVSAGYQMLPGVKYGLINQ